MDSRRRHYAQDDQTYSRGPSLPRSVKPQRSLADVSVRSPAPRREWNTPPRTPQPSRQRRYESGRPTTMMPDRTSISSASSRGSSMFSHQEQAYESSTSIDESSVKPKRDWGASQRRQPPSRLSLGNDTSAGSEPMSTAKGYGADLWNRVASAANALSINVSKAWANGLFSDDGEITPPGGDTRLTLALKNYHLSKAKTTADLPSWLFSAEERRMERNTYASREERHMKMDVATPRQRGLKSVYADVTSGPSTMTDAPRFHGEEARGEPAGGFSRLGLARSDPLSTQSKATSRLEAMRNARQPTASVVREGSIPEKHVDDHDNGNENRNGNWVMRQRQAEMPRRVGLPMGPKQRLN